MTTSQQQLRIFHLGIYSLNPTDWYVTVTLSPTSLFSLTFSPLGAHKIVDVCLCMTLYTYTLSFTEETKTTGPAAHSKQHTLEGAKIIILERQWLHLFICAPYHVRKAQHLKAACVRHETVASCFSHLFWYDVKLVR